MEQMINKINPVTTSEITKKIQSLQNTIRELRGEIKSIKFNKITGQSSSKKEGGGLVHHRVAIGSYLNELRNIYVESVGNFGNRGFALLNVGGRTIKVAIGQNVTTHTILDKVEDNGVVLTLVGTNRKVFIPLQPIIGGHIQYQSVDLKNGSGKSTNTGGLGTQGPPSVPQLPPNVPRLSSTAMANTQSMISQSQCFYLYQAHFPFDLVKYPPI